MSTEGYCSYFAETIKALNKLVDTKTIGIEIKQLVVGKAVDLSIYEDEITEAVCRTNLDHTEYDKSQGINFNPSLGIQSIETGDVLSPAACLGHEIGHILNTIESPEESNIRQNTFCDDGWDRMEEYYTITRWEYGIADEWKELHRAGHNTLDVYGNEKYRVIYTTESTNTTIKEP